MELQLQLLDHILGLNLRLELVVPLLQLGLHCTLSRPRVRVELRTLVELNVVTVVSLIRALYEVCLVVEQKFLITWVLPRCVTHLDVRGWRHQDPVAASRMTPLLMLSLAHRKDARLLSLNLMVVVFIVYDQILISVWVVLDRH